MANYNLSEYLSYCRNNKKQSYYEWCDAHCCDDDYEEDDEDDCWNLD